MVGIGASLGGQGHSPAEELSQLLPGSRPGDSQPWQAGSSPLNPFHCYFSLCPSLSSERQQGQAEGRWGVGGSLVHVPRLQCQGLHLSACMGWGLRPLQLKPLHPPRL